MPNRKKNILITSSWYPTADYPFGGIFVKEQVEALAACTGDNFNYIVSDWGFYDSEVSFLQPSDAFKKIIRFFRAERNTFTQKEGVFYISNPYLNISEKIPYLGNFDRLVDVNLKNIRLAEEKFGPIDLIHAHVCYPGGYLAYRLSKILDIPYVITEHMGPFPFDRYMVDGKPIPELETAAKHADVLIPVSDALSDRMKSFGYENRYVIPNFVDEDVFQPKKSPKPHIPFQFLTLCALEKPKGVEDLIRGIKEWNPAEEEVNFVIAGDGVDRELFQELAVDLEVDSLITWVGKIDRNKVPEFMNRCDAFVLPSHHESFGIVYVEANACGKPVIASRCGGPESIVNEMNGLLVPVSDPVKLAEAMIQMKNNIESYDSEKIRADFMQRFSKRTVLGKITNLYTSLIKN